MTFLNKNIYDFTHGSTDLDMYISYHNILLPCYCLFIIVGLCFVIVSEWFSITKIKLVKRSINIDRQYDNTTNDE